MIDDCGQARHRPSADPFKTRLAPGVDQDRKGDQQGEGGTDHDEGERQRQVTPRGNPVQWYEHEVNERA